MGSARRLVRCSGQYIGRSGVLWLGRERALWGYALGEGSANIDVVALA